MNIYVGTSGYAYTEWRGKFYPPKFKTDEMLPFYAGRFGAVEINNTFYQMPTVEVLKHWADQVGGAFRFAVKAPQVITHRKRLRNADSESDSFLHAISVLKRRLGPVLFQLPPNFKIDVPRLDEFLGMIGRRASMALEFRHASWFDDATYACLRRHRAALCVADADDLPAAPLLDAPGRGYLRLRRERYTDRELRAWLKEIRTRKWRSAYVFFKHEETASGPRLAERFMKLAGE